MKFILTFISGVLFAFVLQAASIEDTEKSRSAAVMQILRDTVSDTSSLHYIKIGKTNELEKYIEQRIASYAKLMNSEMIDEQTTAQETNKIKRYLQLLSVMNEKFNIDLWKKDKELTDIFAAVQAADKNHIEKLRCLDWSQPMWSDKKKC